MDNESGSLLISIVSLVISILTALGNLIVFVVYRRKLSKFALEQANRESEMANSADVIVELRKETGNNALLVKNVGKVAAENVTVEINPDIRSMPRQFPFPMRLESGQTVAISIHCPINGPMSTRVDVKWYDAVHAKGTHKTFDTPLFS